MRLKLEDKHYYQDMNGTYTNHYLDGHYVENTFENGYKVFAREYYPNGNIMLETPYVKGRRHGIMIRYNNDGSIEKRSVLVNGYYSESKTAKLNNQTN